MLMKLLFDSASRQNMPLWVGGGWAIDARLGRVTREHDDIDLTFPNDRLSEFIALIEELGGRVTEETEYGFLADLQGVLLDCEPAHWNGRGYELADTPPGSCPDPLEGRLEGLSLRCNSWEAILWDYFYYASEVPASMWPAKHVQSYALACAAMGEKDVDRLRRVFVARPATIPTQTSNQTNGS